MSPLITDNSYCILQWNCQGARAKKDELLQYIKDFNVDILALQETKFDNNHLIKFPNYNIEKCDGHVNHGAHGGVATYIHSDLPYERVPLNTPIQAVTVKIQTTSLITICNIYSSRSHPLSTALLNNLFNHLSHPLIIIGDFNAYNQMWGSRTRDAFGLVVEDFLTDNNLNIINSGEPTRISYQAQSCIDLTMCFPTLEQGVYTLEISLIFVRSP